MSYVIPSWEDFWSPRTIIWYYLRDHYKDEDSIWKSLFEDFYVRLSTDDIVEWFVNEWFASNETELYAELGEQRAKIVIKYYEAHCRSPKEN